MVKPGVARRRRLSGFPLNHYGLKVHRFGAKAPPWTGHGLKAEVLKVRSFDYNALRALKRAGTVKLVHLRVLGSSVFKLRKTLRNSYPDAQDLAQFGPVSRRGNDER